MTTWRVSVCSSPNHEDLVADISLGEDFICQLDQEDGVERLHVTWSPRLASLGRMRLTELEDAIHRARLRLIELKKATPDAGS